MDLFELNSDNITMNIDGKDIEMKPAICFGKVYDKWLVSECGKVWSIARNKILTGHIVKENYSLYSGVIAKEKNRIRGVDLKIMLQEENWWGDGSSSEASGRIRGRGWWCRQIKYHKVVMDTWAPLYDNPPEGIVWEEWEIVRDLPSVYNHISKTVCIDHIDDDPTNNGLDNLRRVTQWDNNYSRKKNGI